MPSSVLEKQVDLNIQVGEGRALEKYRSLRAMLMLIFI